MRSDSVTEFKIVEKKFPPVNGKGFSVGLANISIRVPDLKANRNRIVYALKQFREHNVNMAVFPEYCLSGCFWDDRDSCMTHMSRTVLERQQDWIMTHLVPLLDDVLKYVVINGVEKSTSVKHPFQNVTCVVDAAFNGFASTNTYKKTFFHSIESEYLVSGRKDRLVLDTSWGRFGFVACYDLCFPILLQEYAFIDQVDAIVVPSAWRGTTMRHYSGVDVGSDNYYGFKWDTLLPAHALINQVWLFACNAVGFHALRKAEFWGGSGVWAPSGIRIAQASHCDEVLLIVRDIDIARERQIEKSDINCADDFQRAYRLIQDRRAFTRIP